MQIGDGHCFICHQKVMENYEELKKEEKRLDSLKQAKLTCKICGEIGFNNEYFVNETNIIIPVCLYTSERQVGKWWKRYFGTTFKHDTGYRIKDAFRKTTIKNMAHFGIWQETEHTDHVFEPFEAWVFKRG